jgi:hypothetical protein
MKVMSIFGGTLSLQERIDVERARDLHRAARAAQLSRQAMGEGEEEEEEEDGREKEMREHVKQIQ